MLRTSTQNNSKTVFKSTLISKERYESRMNLHIDALHDKDDDLPFASQQS